MNPRSDVDFSSPKVDLMVNLSEVAIELNRPQVGICVCVLFINLSVCKSLAGTEVFGLRSC